MERERERGGKGRGSEGRRTKRKGKAAQRDDDGARGKGTAPRRPRRRGRPFPTQPHPRMSLCMALAEVVVDEAAAFFSAAFSAAAVLLSLLAARSGLRVVLPVRLMPVRLDIAAKRGACAWNGARREAEEGCRRRETDESQSAVFEISRARSSLRRALGCRAEQAAPARGAPQCRCLPCPALRPCFSHVAGKENKGRRGAARRPRKKSEIDDRRLFSEPERCLFPPLWRAGHRRRCGSSAETGRGAPTRPPARPRPLSANADRPLCVVP